MKAGFIGATVAVEADNSLQHAPAIDFVARNEFDFTIKEVADGVPLEDIKGLSWRNGSGVVVHNQDRAVLEAWTYCRSSLQSTSATFPSRTTSSAT